MASQSENSVSLEFGELLELLNALEAQDSRPLENFATLERYSPQGRSLPPIAFRRLHQSEIGAGIAEAEEQTSGGERIEEQAPNWREDERPEAEIENRFAVHIVQGMRKSIKDWTS